jgi:hypothetical protein
MLGGTWMPELIAAAGGHPLGVAAGEQAPTLDLAALGTLAPEVVVVKPCGYPVERTLAELGLLPKVLPWETWPTATPTSTAAAPGSSTRPSCWPPACTPAGSPSTRSATAGPPAGSTPASASTPWAADATGGERAGHGRTLSRAAASGEWAS